MFEWQSCGPVSRLEHSSSVILPSLRRRLRANFWKESSKARDVHNLWLGISSLAFEEDSEPISEKKAQKPETCIIFDWEYCIYVVWRVPLADNPLQFRGLHWGLGIRAYAGILRLNQGTFGGIKWRRCNSLELAERLFREELPLPDREIGTEYYEWVRM